MAVFQEQDSGSCSFTVRPNCALSWRATKYLVLFFAGCLGAVGIYFASIGAWIVLPFAGLELAVLAAGFYFSALAGHTREVIALDGPVVRVMRGRRRLKVVASFAANWTRVVLQRDHRGWYPSRLLLLCQGQRLEIASKIVEAEREELALALEDRLGYAHSSGGGAMADVSRSGPASFARELPAGHNVRAFFDEGSPAGVDTPVPPRDKAANSARS